MPTHKQNLRLLSLNQLSEITGHMYRTLKSKLATIEPEEIDGRTQWFNSIKALEAIYYGTDEDRDEDGDEGDEFPGAKKQIDQRYEIKRNWKLKNDHLEHDLLVKRGELLPKAELETWLVNKVVGFKTQLRLIATKLSPQLVGLTERKIEELLTVAHDDALREMAIDEESESDRGDQEEGFEEIPPAAEGDSLPVG